MLRCDDVSSILAGSLLPAIASAQLSAKMSAKTMMGRNIFVSIMQANTEREAAGLASVWPRTQTPAGDDKDDIAGRTYRRSTDYFRDLLDMSNYGKDKWSPYVSGCDLNMFGKNFDLWHVAANVTDEMPDCIPVLISANFDPELLPSKWDGSSNRKLTIEPAQGAAKSLWGDKAIVVVADTMIADTWCEDSSIALTYMHLMAAELNLGSCWVQIHLRDKDGIDAEKVVRDIVKIDDHYRIVGIMALGHSDDIPEPHTLEDIDKGKIHFLV